MDDLTEQALGHVRYLSSIAGGRGSCTAGERQAAEYVIDQLHSLGAQQVRLEPFRGTPSTYRPYALAFSAAVLGTLAVWLVGGRWVMAVAALLNALGAWGMLAETDFAGNWMRALLPTAGSQNAIGVVTPSGPPRHRVVLCAHVDSHRTPVFYASKAWNLFFSALVGAALVSMVLAAVAFGSGALLDWAGARWIGLAALAMELFALVMCIHADFTPFSPGANDNASGVGVVLALARRLVKEPLGQTETWLAFTGCEEVALYGMAAFLDAHAAELGEEAVYIIVDQVGLGRPMLLTSSGLILKHRIHPRALELARRARAALTGLDCGEHVGMAYIDADLATKRGFVALGVDALPPPGVDETLHWHQMSDTLDHVDPACLASTQAFVWQVLQEIDQA